MLGSIGKRVRPAVEKLMTARRRSLLPLSFVALALIAAGRPAHAQAAAVQAQPF
jgi:hypothetical protein